MGVWDYGALDNDPALEVMDRWKQWVDNSPGIGYEGAIDLFFEYWGDSVNYGDNITNMEIIALAAIHLNKSMKLPERLKKATIDALNRELVADELKEWSDPKRREESLLHMLKVLGGIRRLPKTTKEFLDPTIHFKNSQSAKIALIELAKKTKEKGLRMIWYDDNNINIPPFLRTFHRLMMHRIWEKDWNIENQATIERLMMVAWYLTLSIGGSVEDVVKILDSCDSSHKS